MFKRFSFFLFLSISIINIQYSIAQNAQTDSLPPAKIMLIPYDPTYYLSDAERDIEEQSKRDVKKVRQSFRNEIIRDIYFETKDYFNCIDMMHDTSAVVQNDLFMLLGTTGYEYATPIRVKKKEKETKIEKQKNDDALNPLTATAYLNLQGDIKYMSATVSKPKLVETLRAKYNTNYFLYINQFEIKTNYNNCLDIANKIYQRQVMVHFSLYDYTGKQIAGNFAYSLFPSNSSAAADIMKKCFPEIAKRIAEEVKVAISR